MILISGEILCGVMTKLGHRIIYRNVFLMSGASVNPIYTLKRDTEPSVSYGACSEDHGKGQ